MHQRDNNDQSTDRAYPAEPRSDETTPHRGCKTPTKPSETTIGAIVSCFLLAGAISMAAVVVANSESQNPAIPTVTVGLCGLLGGLFAFAAVRTRNIARSGEKFFSCQRSTCTQPRHTLQV